MPGGFEAQTDIGAGYDDCLAVKGRGGVGEWCPLLFEETPQAHFGETAFIFDDS